MNDKVQGKKSNARIAWDDFIGNFSLSDKQNIVTEPAEIREAAASTVVETEAGTGGKSAGSVAGHDIAEPPRMTVIGEKASMVGNCTIEGDVQIYGEVTGDIQAGGNIGIFGRVTGNVSGKNVLMNQAEVRGNITARENIELDDNSVVTDGKMVADSIISNGKTECDMEVSKIVRFGAHASACGNIVTALISIEEGAAIQGSITCK